MARYSEKLTDKIIALIEEDNDTVTDICRILRIGQKTFYRWRSEKPEFELAVNKAIENREERLKLQARKSIRLKLGEYRQMETKTTYVAGKDSDNPNELTVKEYVVKEKYCMPDTSVITFTLADQKSGKKESAKLAENKSPLLITVSDEKAKRELEIFRKNLTT